MIGNQSSLPVQNNEKLENSKSEEDKDSKLPKFTVNWFQLFRKYSEFLANFCIVNLTCYKWASCFYFQNVPHVTLFQPINQRNLSKDFCPSL